MLSRHSVAVFALLFFVHAANAFAPPGKTLFFVAHGKQRAYTLKSASTADDLVTREANVKPMGRRTKATLDPFNPNFDEIRAVPYHEAFPESTKEYTQAIHEPTGHLLQVRIKLASASMIFAFLFDFFLILHGNCITGFGFLLTRFHFDVCT